MRVNTRTNTNTNASVVRQVINVRHTNEISYFPVQGKTSTAIRMRNMESNENTNKQVKLQVFINKWDTDRRFTYQ